MHHAANAGAAAGDRSVAVDAYRGFVMLLMMAEVLQLSRVAHAYPASTFWRVLAYHQTHVDRPVPRSTTRSSRASFGRRASLSIASRLAKRATFVRMPCTRCGAR